MNILELVAYYVGLLILEYIGLPAATGFIGSIATPVLMGQMQNTVQVLTFDDVAASGNFTLTFGTDTTVNIEWNDPNTTIISDINAVIGFNKVTSLIGSLASRTLVITFNNAPDIPLLIATSNLFNASVAPIAITVNGNLDLGPLPLQVQNAFDIDTAVGVQLDVLGKYAGVSRSGFGFTGPITLDDADFRQLIRVATVTNNSGSDLATIQNLLNTYFPGELFVFDYANMRMAYSMNSSVGSQNLAQLFVTEGLLPKPMGVQLSSLIYGPDLTHFFGLRTYDAVLFNVSGINTYDAYSLTAPMLTYDDAIST